MDVEGVLLLLSAEKNKSRPAFASKPLIYYQIRTRHSQTFSRFGKQSKAQKKKEHKMSEDAKRSVPGALSAKPNSDDRKPSPAVTTATGKRVIIKSADMFQDMQKEAVDIAIGVSSSLSLYILFLLLLLFLLKFLIMNLWV